MRARIADSIKPHAFASEAAAIVRSCVHCGFCNATCPTYQLSGDELEGPRGRIYLIKSLLEAGDVGATTRIHLDQCLVCRNCETTCPSGVEYGRLLEIVRPAVHAMVGLPWVSRAKRWLLARIVPYPARLRPVAALGRLFRPLLPSRVRRMLPAAPSSAALPVQAHARRVLLLGGCAQAVLNPHIDDAAAMVFDRLGMSLIRVRGADCCGALTYHLGYERAAIATAKANVDAWWPHIVGGAEAVMATSSGCGLQLKDYARLLAHEAGYAERVARIQELVRDPLELLDADRLRPHVASDGRRLALQTPCTLQHGQRLGGRLEILLRSLGWTLTAVTDPHLCCGSAGAYSLLQPRQAGLLRADKLEKLLRDQPAEIITANIGCQLHLAAGTAVPVRHWLELVAESLRGR